MYRKGRVAKLILSTIISTLILSMTFEVYASMPKSVEGEPYDGVNFDVLSKGGIYYGAYAHALSLEIQEGRLPSYGKVTSREKNPTPIWWNALEEEAGDGNITLMSFYILDSKEFFIPWGDNRGKNYYNNSDIRTWLNKSFLTNFNVVEQLSMVNVNVKTNMYDEWSDNGYKKIIGTHKAETYTYPDKLPWNTYNDKMYLPWAKARRDSNRFEVYYTANGDVENSIPANKVSAWLKNGAIESYWWTRTPSSIRMENVLAVDDRDRALSFNGRILKGIRPVFKLNPKTIIFASEIKINGDESKGETKANSNYAIDTFRGTRNFKLTVLNTKLPFKSLIGPTGELKGNGETIQIELGKNLNLTSPLAGSGRLAYKIVDRSSGEIVGYGVGSNEANSNKSLTISSSGLTAGDKYTLYVWGQQNNEIRSNEGTTPKYFKLEVKETDFPTSMPNGDGEINNVEIKGNKDSKTSGNDKAELVENKTFEDKKEKEKNLINNENKIDEKDSLHAYSEINDNHKVSDSSASSNARKVALVALIALGTGGGAFLAFKLRRK